MEAREEWRKWRTQGIGGSDAPAICGFDPWRSPLMVWLEKRGLSAPDVETEWQRWGKRLETVIIDEFEDRTGLYTGNPQFQAENPELPWQRATLDAFVAESPWESWGVVGHVLGILEIKTASWRSPLKWVEEGKPVLPLTVQTQVQHNLAVTGLEHAWVAVLLDGQTLYLHELERDPEAIEALTAIEARFWEAVGAGTPPPVSGLLDETPALRAAFPEGAGSVALGEEDARLLQDYRHLSLERRHLESRISHIRGRLMLLLGDKEIGTYNGSPAVSWKTHKRTQVDSQALRARPELWEEFSTQQQVRRLWVAGVKEEESEDG